MDSPEDAKLKAELQAYQSNLENILQARTGQFMRATIDLEQSHDVALESLVGLLGMHYPELEAHSKRVTAFTIAIARAAEIPLEKIRAIAHGAFLHDVGMISVPSDIVRKPGQLVPDEWVALRQHCHSGFQLLQKMPFASEAAEIVYAHHERFDGSGYPRGLKGNEIPVGARIVAIADALDAITSDWVYRAAQTFDSACQEIERWSGRQFDPTFVRVFVSMPVPIFETVKRQIQRENS